MKAKPNTSWSFLACQLATEKTTTLIDYACRRYWCTLSDPSSLLGISTLRPD